ncbi:MAG: hypothetical protein ACRDXB_00345, partial [Actinomycetes bacterium]
AAQARCTATLDASQRAAQAAAGVPASRRGQGVAGQIGLARRESAFRGSQHLGLAKVLTTEMPHTLAAMQAGTLSEWRATLLARETATLTAEHRRLIDARIAANPEGLQGWGDRRLVAEIQKLAYTLDPASVTRRRAHAEADRRVTCRPAPDTMAILSALLPVAQGVAVWATLCREADSRIATGDGRTRNQIMADTLVTRITGQAEAATVPVEVHLVMTDQALLRDDDDGGDGDGDGGGDGGGGGGGDSDEPAHLCEFGPIPADLARRLTVEAAQSELAWLRRLYTTPDTGELISMDSRRRFFPRGLARFIRVRDQYCRTPWCDAPIRHTNHAQPHHQDGPTSATNGEATCAQCNYHRQAPGWQTRPHPGPRHTLTITTPTGHTYITIAPRPPGAPPRTRRRAPRRRTTRTPTTGVTRRRSARSTPRATPKPRRRPPPTATDPG